MSRIKNWEIEYKINPSEDRIKINMKAVSIEEISQRLKKAIGENLEITKYEIIQKEKNHENK